MDLWVEKWTGDQDRPEYYNCRRQVFEPELQGRPAHDEFDPYSTHFAAGVGTDMLACGRLMSGPLQSVTHIPQHLLPRELAGVREPSRVGVVPQARGTDAGMHAFLALVGSIIEDGMSDPLWIITQFRRLFLALNWIPFSLGDPFHYASDDIKGPLTEQFIWPAVLNPREAMTATWYLKREYWGMMFPRLNSLPDWNDVRPPETWAALADLNRRHILTSGKAQR